MGVSRGGRAVERAEVLEEVFGAVEAFAVGGFEPAEGVDVFDAARLEGEDDFREVEAADLGGVSCGGRSWCSGSVQSRRQWPGAVRPARPARWSAEARLIFFDEEGVDAPVGVEAGDAGLAGVDDEADAVDGEAGFGDVGADDHLALAVVAGDGGVLVGGGEFAVKREDDPAAGERGTEGADGAVDLVAARHEDEGVAFGVRAQEAAEFFGGEVPGRDAVERGGTREVLDRDGIGATRGSEGFAGGEVLFQAGGFKRRRHDDEQEVGAGGFLDLQGAGEGDVAVEVAFVELVEDEGGDTGEGGVGEHLAQEDALGDVLDAGAAAGDVVQTDAVADLVADAGVVAFAGDAGGEHPGREAARLEDDGATIGAEETGVEEHLRDLRRFAGAGGGLEDDAAGTGAEAADEVVREFVDREAVGGGCGRRRCHPLNLRVMDAAHKPANGSRISLCSPR